MNKKFYIAIGTLLLLSAAVASQAATLIVVNKNNSGAGSLRQATIDAASGDTVIFAPGLNGSIQLASPIIIDKNITITGPGANVLSVEGRDQPTESRVFSIFSGSVARISDLRISRGFSSGGGGGMTIESGAIVTLNNCLISENVAESAGGIIAGTGVTLTITNSTFVGNVSFVEGGTVSMRGGTLTMINSTITGNEAPDGGGISVDNAATATILNSTISENGNTGGTSGEIGGLRVTGGSTVNLKNTIIAKNNVLGTSIADVGGTVSSQGNNLIGNATGGTGFIASDLLNVDPLFGGFGNNGGAIPTQALLTGSPAINAGNNTGAPATDQRGVARPQGVRVDIGAFESGGSFPVFGKIVYVSTQDGNAEIYSMNADFSNQTRLTNNFADDSAPKWSPDGSKIVFQSSRDGGFPEIYTMNADGSNQTRITNNSIEDANPDWSPNGSTIAFVRGNSLPSEIWVMSTAGAGQTQITNSTLFGETHPSWSPDGSRIAFSANPTTGEGPEIYVMNADGTNKRRQTFDPATDNYPAWSPDNFLIAYTNDSSVAHTNILNLLNSSVRSVSNPNHPLAFAPAWSPDGTKLAHYDSAGNIYVIGASGSNRSFFADFFGAAVVNQLDWFGVNTPSGTGISVVLGTTSITYSSITIPGNTSVLPYDVPPYAYPPGYACSSSPCRIPGYEVQTTSTYTAPITVCLQVPSVTDPVEFDRLRILHYVNGTPTDATILPPSTPAPNFTTKTICARVNSLSPFIMAEFTGSPVGTPTATGTNTPTATQTSTSTSTPTNTATNTPTPPTSIGGTVTYGNAIGAPTPRFVSNVLMSGAGSPTVSALTDNFGSYSLTGFGAGSYTVTPSKTGGVNSTITSFDAALVAQHVAGSPLPHLSGNQLIVADVSGNGEISSFDAAQIARYVVAASGSGSTGNWIFNPVSSTYPSVTNSITGQDYSALLMGEVSGNWNGPNKK